MQTTSEKKGDVKILSAYSPKKRVQVQFEGKGRTKQSFKDECDINNIIARFLRTGVMDFTQKNEPRYSDVTGIEFDQAMRVVAHARTMFEELPAKIRAEFENDPAAFLDFVQDPANREACEELGLMRRAEPPPVGGQADASAAAAAAGASEAGEEEVKNLTSKAGKPASATPPKKGGQGG